MNQSKVILASNSPRRKELLSRILPLEQFVIIGSNIQEKVKEDESAESFSTRMAEEKARDVARKHVDGIENASVVIGADTVVLLEEEIIGQPSDRDDAIRILRRLSGHSHEVITGVAIFLVEENRTIEFAVRSEVWMKELSDETIEKYVESGEPMDKAGAYAIQGVGRDLIEKFEGSLTNIIGLPVEELREVLRTVL